MKKTTTYTRVVWKPIFSDAPPAKKAKTPAEPSGKVRAKKKKKLEIDETLKSSKIESPYEIVSPLTLQ